MAATKLETTEEFLARMHPLTRHNMQLNNIYRDLETHLKTQGKRLTEYQVCVEAVLQALTEDKETSDASKIKTIKEIMLNVHTGNLENTFKLPVDNSNERTDIILQDEFVIQ